MQTQAEEELQYKERTVSRPSFKVGVALNNSHKWHLLPSKIRSDGSCKQPEGGRKSQRTQHQCIYKIPNYHIVWVMELQGACPLIELPLTFVINCWHLLSTPASTPHRHWEAAWLHNKSLLLPSQAWVCLSHTVKPVYWVMVKVSAIFVTGSQARSPTASSQNTWTSWWVSARHF